MPWHRGAQFYRTRGEIQTPVRGDGNRRSLQTRETAFRNRLTRYPLGGPVVVDRQAGQRACRGDVGSFGKNAARSRPQAGST